MASIPSNIAEGTSQASAKGFARFLRIALGSAYEAETQLRLGRDLGYLARPKVDLTMKELDEIRRMLVALIHSKSPEFQGPHPPPTPNSEV
jgi:four helix bundle protein